MIIVPDDTRSAIEQLATRAQQLQTFLLYTTRAYELIIATEAPNVADIQGVSALPLSSVSVTLVTTASLVQQTVCIKTALQSHAEEAQITLTTQGKPLR